MSLDRVDCSVINYELIEELLVALLVDGAGGSNSSGDCGTVLVFLPGIAEITRLLNMLESNRHFSSTRDKSTGDQSFILLPLHSSLPAHEQQRVFDPAPPHTHKIVVSTNIAETSVTISDVTSVVDCGLVKQVGYEAGTRTSTLHTVWCSRAAADQRKGRAGRVQAGRCFRLFTDEI